MNDDKPEKQAEEGAGKIPLQRVVMPFWNSLYGDGGHYNISRCASEETAMEALRTMFPNGGKSINEMNFVLFSTSGVHGTYATIEEAEEDPELGVTFLILHPRLVGIKYGHARPETEEDFSFLKEIREASWKVMVTIGA